MQPGLTACTCSGPMPQRSIVPGRKFSTITSAPAHNSAAICCPRGSRRLSATERLLRESTDHQSEWSLWRSCPHSRIGSPRGRSLDLHDVGAEVASSVPTYGPARSCPNSIARRPVSGPEASSSVAIRHRDERILGAQDVHPHDRLGSLGRAFGKRRDELAMARLRERAMRLRRARTRCGSCAGCPPWRAAQPTGAGCRRPRSRSRGTPRSRRSGRRSRRRRRLRAHPSGPRAHAAGRADPRSRAARRARRPPARAAPAPRRGRSGRRSRTGARARRGAARCRRAPRPRAARAPRARACASFRSAWRATRCAAADQARTHPRESPPAAPRKREGSSSGWAMIGEAAVKECIQNHAATPKATREPRILHSKRPPAATSGVWPAWQGLTPPGGV